VPPPGRVAELVYATDLKSVAARLEGSSPSPPTTRLTSFARGKPFATLSLSKYGKPSESSDFERSREANMSWHVYIARARTDRYYTGIAIDPVARLNRHNTGAGARFARQQGPFKLVYVSKPYLNKSDARKREVQIKDWSQMKKQKLINGDLK
jgi:putative endonuclease